MGGGNCPPEACLCLFSITNQASLLGAIVEGSHQEVVCANTPCLGNQPDVAISIIYLLVNAGMTIVSYGSPDQAMNFKFKPALGK
ncbi:MAG: hypothetical protein DRI01_08335 [Chloroflexi bacterium]|nr:MAG: hypothetical protein DRI01_08335 [Chloroflexota bacterium]